MLRRLLSQARTTPFGEDVPLTGGGRQQFEALRDDALADTISQNGGLGFADAIEAQLEALIEQQGAAR